MEDFSKIVDQSFTKSINEDVLRLVNTTRMTHYAAMKSHAVTEPNLMMNLPFTICSIISQLRIGLYSIKLGDRKVTITTRCPFCTSGSDATIDHFTMKCRIITPIRDKHLYAYVKDFSTLTEMYNFNRTKRQAFLNHYFDFGLMFLINTTYYNE